MIILGPVRGYIVMYNDSLRNINYSFNEKFYGYLFVNQYYKIGQKPESWKRC